MQVFKYTGYDAKYAKVSGSIQATDERTAIANLRSEGIRVNKITPASDSVLSSLYTQYIDKVPNTDLYMLFSMLGGMVQSNITPSEALEASIGLINNKKLKASISRIVVKVQSGATLSEAFHTEPAFEAYCSALIKMGEESGTLADSFKKLSEFYSRKQGLKGKIMQALLLPIITLIAALIVLYVVSVYVFPSLDGLGDGSNFKFATDVVRAISNIGQKYGPLPILVTVIIFLILPVIFKTKFRRQLDNLIIRIPAMRNDILEQFVSSFYILYNSGMKTPEVLEIIKGIIGNKVFEDDISNAILRMKAGTKFSEAINEDLYGDLLMSIIRSGEVSDTIGDSLKDIHPFLRTKVEHDHERMMTMLKPVTTIILAVIVGFVVMGVMGPILNLYQNIQF